MTGDKDKLSDFKEFKGGYVAFGNDSKGGRISGKGTIKTSCIDFEKVSYVEELKFNLLSVSQICDKKHNVLFTDKECLILSPKFKFVDEDLVILRAPRKNDVYSLDLKNIIPSGGIVWLQRHKDEGLLAQRLACQLQEYPQVVKASGLEENQKGKGPDWMFDLELLTPSMNYIPVRKENYADSGGKDKHSEEYTADKEVPLSSEEQALHDELVSLMHQESIAKVHNDAQRNAFEKEKRKIALEKGKECVDSTFTLSTANTPSQSTGNTPTDSDDDVPKDGVFSTNSFDDENTDNEEDREPDYTNMDHTSDVSSTPTLRIHKNHPQSQIIGKSTAGVLTRRKLKESASVQHQALLSFIYKQNRTNHKDQQTCLFACFLSQEKPKKVLKPLAYVNLGLKRCKKNCFNTNYKRNGVITIKPTSTPIEAHKSLGKDEEGEEVDVHTYSSKIYGLSHVNYNCSTTKTLMFAGIVFSARYQVTLKYLKDSPFHLEAFSDSDYTGDNHDRRSTLGRCQYLGRRLVSWQCKKQTIMAISSTEAEYVAAASCCAQVLWMQNQLLDYGFNFMNTEIHIDNESTICIVKNPVLHSKTKHIQIRHHFIRDCYEQRRH
ncbi:hypothetical protein Tco_0060652 [Tanacetum coccineum]